MTIKDNYRQEPTPSTTLHSLLIIYPLSFLFVLLFTACDPGDPAVDALHHAADSLMAVGRPDSALHLLHTLNGDPSRRQLMRHELLYAKAMNKAYVPFTTDSVMKAVTNYYDRHGTPNERMEAHYLLGCTYRDMGEAPRAIDCYLDAAACADTTAKDCDFWMMASVYGQMAYLYHQQFLLSYEIDAHRLASRYNYLAGDTLYALFEQKMIAGAYILQNKKDSAETILNDVIRLYRERGQEQKALQTSTMMMCLLIDSLGRQTELKQLIDAYDAKFKPYNDYHEQTSSFCLFYYYKGHYFDNISLLDSAEYYYRKSYIPGIPGQNSTANEGAYKGLLSVFSKLGLSDSIAKYARLYCEVNDSTVSRKDQEVTAQMTASYNYRHYQKEAQENERKAHRTELMLIALSVVLCVLVATGTYVARLYKSRQQRKRKALEEEHRRREAHLREAHRQELAEQESLFLQKEGELKRMEDIYHKVTETIRQELDCAKSESLNMRENYAKARLAIEEINAHYEKDKNALNEEIRALKLNIAELKKREVFTDNKGMASRLHATDIVMNLKSRSDKPNKVMTTKESEELSDMFRQFFPMFIQDMKLGKGLNKTDETIAMLTALGLKPGQIQCLTDKSSSQITNSKSKTNRILFADSSASSLYQNMVLRYGI